ncbi:hypothetical protein A3709_18805 [Halioglobus sp. HI00S01]|nr:hypothetical protein A3709_18805 [Halioglobus sp. HI00S01]
MNEINKSGPINWVERFLYCDGEKVASGDKDRIEAIFSAIKEGEDAPGGEYHRLCEYFGRKDLRGRWSVEVAPVDLSIQKSA